MRVRYKGVVTDRRTDKIVFETNWRDNFAEAYNQAEDVLNRRKLSPQFYAITLKEERYE